MPPRAATNSKPAKKKQDEKRLAIQVKHYDKVLADPLEYDVVSDKEVNFTENEAIRFLELKTFQGERPIREHHVQHLYDEYVAGRFLWQNVLLASAQLGDDRFRINGQHTSWMRLNIKESVKPAVREVVYRVPDDDNLRNLYCAFDGNAPRTFNHRANVMLVNSQAAKDIPMGYLNCLNAGFRIFQAPYLSERGMRISAPELVNVIEKQYSGLYNSVAHFVQQHYGDATWLRRAAVVGAIFATFERSIAEAHIFWEPVISGIGLKDREDIQWQLRRFIESKSHSTMRGKDPISQEGLYSTCVAQWNYWRAGEKITKIQPSEKRVKAR